MDCESKMCCYFIKPKRKGYRIDIRIGHENLVTPVKKGNPDPPEPSPPSGSATESESLCCLRITGQMVLVLCDVLYHVHSIKVIDEELNMS